MTLIVFLALLATVVASGEIQLINHPSSVFVRVMIVFHVCAG